MHLMGLSFNINFQSGLKLHGEVVLPDDDSLEPVLYHGLVEGFQMCRLLLDEILQLVDAGNLCVPGGSVNRAFLALFPECRFVNHMLHAVRKESSTSFGDFHPSGFIGNRLYSRFRTANYCLKSAKEKKVCRA